jgi:hypothetical protein
MKYLMQLLLMDLLPIAVKAKLKQLSQKLVGPARVAQTLLRPTPTQLKLRQLIAGAMVTTYNKNLLVVDVDAGVVLPLAHLLNEQRKLDEGKAREISDADLTGAASKAAAKITPKAVQDIIDEFGVSELKDLDAGQRVEFIDRMLEAAV